MRHVSTPQQEEFVGLSFLYRAGADRTQPLVVLVHGRAGTREVIWTFERSIPPHVAVVSLQGFTPDRLGGFSWWDMDIESSQDRTLAIERAMARLASGIERVVELFELAPSKVYAIGFSQGAALLSRALLNGAVRLDGLAVLAGFIPQPEHGANLLSTPEVFVAHGREDEVVPIDRARAGVSYLQQLGLSVTCVEDDVAHKVGIQGTRELKSWLAARL